jgi:hypothetical protein
LTRRILFNCAELKVDTAKQKPPEGGFSIDDRRSGGDQCWLRLPAIGHEAKTSEAEKQLAHIEGRGWWSNLN